MKRKLGINCDCYEGVWEVEMLELIKEAGFQCFFKGPTNFADKIGPLKVKADELGLEFLFIHAPFNNINAMWLPGDDYLQVYKSITETIDLAAEHGIPYVVIHASAGWKVPSISDIGLKRYDMLMEYAAQKKVVVAVENSRVVGNVAYFTERYVNNEYVRFCYDCGHEHCFTKTVKWMDIFGDRMVVTHIHDNFGRGPKKVGMPDLHLLPFDGNIDYAAMMNKLDEYNYGGALTLEVSSKRHENYMKMSPEEFVKTAYERLQNVQALSK